MLDLVRHLWRIPRNVLSELFYRQTDLHRSPVAGEKEIGLTVKKKSIVRHQIGNGEKHILFLSAIHGNEVGTVYFANNLIRWLKRNIDAYPGIQASVIPCLNLDGYEQARLHPDYFHGGRIGRVNTNRVDLNRNFPTNSFQSSAYWSSGKNYQDKTPVFAGMSGGSEPETQALMRYIKDQRVHFIFSFHNAGKDVHGSKDVIGTKIASIYAEKTRYRLLQEDEWIALQQTGTLKEWCESQTIPFVEVEQASRWNPDWKIQQPAIEAILKEIQTL